MLLAPANVALHGNPGSGKSWMASTALGLLDEDDSLHLVRLDLSTVKRGKDVFTEIADRCGGNGVAESSLDVRSAWKAARAAIGSFDRHVVFVLEEFDGVLRFEDGEEFLRLLRELVHLPDQLGCSALVVSRRTIASIEASIRGISTLNSVFYTQYVGSLGEWDLDGMVGGVQGLSERERRECLEWSGGHPALARYWLTVRPAEEDVDLDGEYEIGKVVFRVLEHLTSIDLLSPTAQLVLGPVVDDLFLEKRELQLLGVIPAGEAETVSLSDSLIFRQALRQETRGMDPWGVMGRAEVATRGVIESTLTAAYGTDWVNVVAKRNKGVASAHEGALMKIEQDERAFGRRAPWLSYTYPRDLWNIIQVEWALFADVFASRDKAYWRNVWLTLGEYRAPLAHGRAEVLSESRRGQCRTYAEVVLSELDRAESRQQGLLLGAEHGAGAGQSRDMEGTPETLDRP